MLGLSLPEVIFLAVLALVVIGPKQLPEVARTLGRMLNELRRASNSFTEEFKQQVRIDPIRLEDPKPSEKQEVKPHEPNQGGNYIAEEPMNQDKPEESEVKKS